MDELDATDGKFVKRQSLEDELSAELKSALPEGKTVLVFSQRGSGKTSCIQFALKGQRGVIIIRIGKNTHDEASTDNLSMRC